MARELLALADAGDADRTDDGCGVLYGIVRDCAYKMRAQAGREQEAHKARGIWDEHEEKGGAK
jgi:hypothetical protein